jgi:predicted DNA-binding transcriptional regulator YafY
MYHPTTRVLAVLELLQAHGRMTGAEIARRLEVDVRTARRYIEMLQDLGIPVEGERGRHGAYRLRPGFKLPPLMLTEDEALAVILGLLTARRLGLGAAAPAVEGTLAKVERVLPAAVRERVSAVEETLVLAFRSDGIAPAGEVVLTLSVAARDGRRVRLRYRSAEGDETERDFDPYGLVCREGKWYATGHCHLRHGRRLLRIDRMLSVQPLEATFSRPASFDALQEVERSIAAMPGTWPLEVLLETTLDEATLRISPLVGSLKEVPGGVLLHGSTSDLDWMASYLAGRCIPFVVRQPVELREALRRLAASLAAAAERTDDPLAADPRHGAPHRNPGSWLAKRQAARMAAAPATGVRAQG